mmetsp:Transcript_38184/g.96656  ORF Transcript_38184/g.96656 Transcript_38184/m.96656 type:complete len:252 (+) Transcript_38184:221-976(+)
MQRQCPASNQPATRTQQCSLLGGGGSGHGGSGPARARRRDARLQLWHQRGQRNHVLALGVHVLDLDVACSQLLVPKQYHEGDGLLQRVVELVAHLGIGLEPKLGLDAGGPQRGCHLHALHLHVVADGRHQDLGLNRAHGPPAGRRALAHLRLHDGKHALDADGHAHRGHVLAAEHPHQLVVPPACRDTAHVGALEHRLVDDACVVVQAARQRQVEAHGAQRAHGARKAEQGAQLLQRLLAVRVLRQLVLGR